MALAFIFFHENEQLNSGFFGGMAVICLSVVLQTMKVIRSRSTKGYIEEKGGIGD